MLGLQFQAVVCTGQLLFHDFGQVAVQGSLRQVQISLGLHAIALNARPGISGNFEHRRVLAQRMDKQRLHFLVAGLHRAAPEQERTVAASPHLFLHRDTKLGTILLLGAIGQVCHGQQSEFAVVNAEYLVPPEVQAIHIQPDLRVLRGIAKTQITVMRAQRQQVPGNAAAVVGPQGANRDDERGRLLLPALRLFLRRRPQG